MPIRRIVVALSLLAVLCQLTPALADGDGTRAVRSANDALRSLLAKEVPAGSAAEKKHATRITGELRSFLDVDELGKRAMRDHWDGLNAEQRKEFNQLLRDLIEKNYIKGMRANLNYKVVYTGEETKGESVVVATEVRARRRGRPYTVSIDYVLRKQKQGWRAYDVVTDGVGLVENYRAQFNKIIAKDGVDGLLGRMRRKRERS